jgi:6-pyruvoyltetrahydropterin/6-carboxytetrahydropterin synthase
MPTTPHISTIELFKEEMKFSAGHFTIFSATERERLHGHNFTVHVALTGRVDDNGMIANYGRFKTILFATCRDWNEYMLLPGRSPFLRLREDGDHLYATFDGVDIPFLRGDVLVLDVTNVTIEELARLITEQLVSDERIGGDDRLDAIAVKVASGPGQFASYEWRNNNGANS